MDIEKKENSIKELLQEMGTDFAIEKEFTDLLIRSFTKVTERDTVDTWASDGCFKTIKSKSVDRDKIIVSQNRYNDICLEKTRIENGFLKLVYDKSKEVFLNIENINQIFTMKKGESNVY